MIGYREVLTISIGMSLALCGTEIVTIKTVYTHLLFLLWQGLTFASTFHFSISINIVNKNGNFRN